MTLPLLKAKFNSVLGALNATPTINFCQAVEAAFEALTLAHAIREFDRIHGGITNIQSPTSPAFLNQKPGRFLAVRSYLVRFNSGACFYFATDVEVFGLNALHTGQRAGIKFEADVVVISEVYEPEIRLSFNGYPAPQHLTAVYECKFGEYNKGQLRELLGLRRHISFLSGQTDRLIHDPRAIHYQPVMNANPPIAVKMARPKSFNFFDRETACLYDLQQIVVN